MDMNIKAYADRMSVIACQPAEGDTPISLWHRIRMMKSRNWSCWRAILYALKEAMVAVLRVSLKTSWLAAFFVALSLTHAFVHALTYIYEPVAVEDPLRREISRGPPKPFIPIPKIEAGGCARSDSLVRSLIF
ncbi:MAG: hypothetical protein EAZ78_25335 [Oscillatoriales cyanobacterium]|nr:MAG: hypothetical protein EA000_26410 [Oscillatoriales cyanobacterium]TAD93020.1 MAG: hypothetical protein EAZ98_24255 [Oscillatoriales cyanobacterium]TAE97787.1 MAG: hypothetical protein EAZ78_25335 [Oscillatoriales cyanobacterium]TAF32323.1 MAG: hypothetical protein EAZ68_21035 [Oscillatoriales cyanobacterium]TAF68329.1 MAG: hypothetical protein EAZ59_11510 [Oscillatoriales cyanobacterium]